MPWPYFCGVDRDVALNAESARRNRVTPGKPTDGDQPFNSLSESIGYHSSDGVGKSPNVVRAISTPEDPIFNSLSL